MEMKIKPKWDLPTAIRKADDSYALATKYRADLESRLKPDELSGFKSEIDLLATRRPAQQENLIIQKSKTRGQDEIAADLHQTLVSVRGLVKAADATDEILKAYGVGEKISNNVLSVTVGANLVLKAYTQYTTWSKNEAGILQDDIEEITELLLQVSDAANVQDNSVIFRKDGTVDKNVLQRKVEDEVTRLSAIGAHVFRRKNPAIALQFENLIPDSDQPDDDDENPAP